jgi:DNA-binding NtrC family response regulator
MWRKNNDKNGIQIMAKILIVDDELLIREILQESLSRNNHEILSVMDAHQAINTVNEHFPDLALIDVQLTASSGIDLTKVLKEIHPDLIVIIMTGYPNFDTIMSATRLGAIEYLTKPFKLDELNKTIDKHLNIS